MFRPRYLGYVVEGVKFGFSAIKELKKSVLYQTLEKCRGVFWFVFWFSSAINVLVLFLPLYTSQVLDRVLSSGSSSTLLMLSIVTVGALVCSSMLDVCRSLTMAKVADWIDREATPDLIARAISLTSVKASTSSGEAIRDLGVVKGFITGFGVLSLFDMPWAVVYLAAIFMIHPVTGYIAVVGIALLVLMAVWNELATKRVMQESNEENVRNINYIDVASRNAEVVEAMGMVRHIVTEWSSRNTHNRKLQIKAQGRSNVIMGVTKFVRSVLQISVIGVGAWLAIHGHKTAGGIIAASILMGRALAPFEAAINTWKMLLSARISYRRLQALLLAFPKREQAMALPTPKGSITMDRVFFTPYGGSKPTIKGVSFGVEPGSIVGIIGPSASGKSTLAKLLVGVWKPLSGVVRLDGADVYTWNREDFGCHVGYLPQDVELFQASVKTNIARMAPDPDPEKVIKAAKIAGIHEMILHLPSGYDTVIGGNGVVLSGGQKQMLGLARAFYGDVRLLVLDEPNANLDGRAEANLVHALTYAKQCGITTFVVTHKMQLLGAVEQVIVMDDGMMAAMGDRDEILSRFTANKSPASSGGSGGREGTGVRPTSGQEPSRIEASPGAASGADAHVAEGNHAAHRHRTPIRGLKSDGGSPDRPAEGAAEKGGATSVAGVVKSEGVTQRGSTPTQDHGQVARKRAGGPATNSRAGSPGPHSDTKNATEPSSARSASNSQEKSDTGKTRSRAKKSTTSSAVGAASEARISDGTTADGTSIDNSLSGVSPNTKAAVGTGAPNNDRMQHVEAGVLVSGQD